MVTKLVVNHIKYPFSRIKLTFLSGFNDRSGILKLIHGEIIQREMIAICSKLTIIITNAKHYL